MQLKDQVQNQGNFRFKPYHDDFIKSILPEEKEKNHKKKNQIYKIILQKCLQINHLFPARQRKYHWKSFKNRIVNYIDQSVKSQKISKEHIRKALQLHCKNISYKQIMQILNIDSMNIQTLRNALKKQKQKIGRFAYQIFKEKFNTEAQNINNINKYFSKKINHFRVLLVLFSKGQLLQMYQRNSNLISIPELLRLGGQFKESTVRLYQLKKNRAKEQEVNKEKKRKAELQKMIRNELNKINDTYLQIPSNIKFSNAKYRKCEQLCKQIIMNDFKGQDKLKNVLEKLKHVNTDQSKTYKIETNVQDIQPEQPINLDKIETIEGRNYQLEFDYNQQTTILNSSYIYQQALQPHDRYNLSIQLEQNYYSSASLSYLWER